MTRAGIRRQGRDRDRRRDGDRLRRRPRLRPLRRACRDRRPHGGDADPCRGADRGAGRGAGPRRSRRTWRTPPTASGSSPRRSSGSARSTSSSTTPRYFALVPLIDADAAQAARFLGINLAGPLHCARAFARWAFERGRGGAIVNISSIAGARPAPGCGLYSASKAALDSSPARWRSNGRRRACGSTRSRRAMSRPRA